MATTAFLYRPIFPGFAWGATFRLEAEAPVFPDGVQLRAEVRVSPTYPVLATLTTANGGLVCLDGNRLAVSISDAMSAKMRPGAVYLDIIRTDVTPPQHLGVRIHIPIRASVTAAHG